MAEPVFDPHPVLREAKIKVIASDSARALLHLKLERTDPKDPKVVLEIVVKEAVVLRSPPAVHIFQLVSHGRRWNRSLEFTSDAARSLGVPSAGGVNLAPTPRPHWAGGEVADLPTPKQSLVITRPLVHGVSSEEYIPDYLLCGLLPEALITAYHFWQRPDGQLVGNRRTAEPGPVKAAASVGSTDQLLVALSEARYAVVYRIPMDQPTQPPHASSPSPPPPLTEARRLLCGAYAPTESALGRLVSLLERIEDLGHVLLWSSADGLDSSGPPSSVQLELVELPRLRLEFTLQRDTQGVARLQSVQHPGLFVSWLRSERAASLLRGLPHALLLENAEGDVFLLLSALCRPCRVSDSSDPLSAQLLLARHTPGWADSLPGVRHYLYPLHRSGAFVTPPSLAARLYLLMLRWLGRDHEAAFQLAKCCASDTALSAEEGQLWALLADMDDDVEPGSHCVRLQLWFAARGCPELRCPWQVSEQLELYLLKLPFIPAGLRLAAQDELSLLRTYSDLPQAAGRAAYLMAALTKDGSKALKASYPSRPRYKDYDEPIPYASVLQTAATWQKKMASAPYTRPEEKSGVEALKQLNGWLSAGFKLDADGGRGFWFQYELLTGSIAFTVLPEDRPFELGCLLSRLSAHTGVNSTTEELTPLLMLLEAEPGLAAELPRFSGSTGQKGLLGKVGFFKGKAGKGLPDEISAVLTRLVPQLPRHAKPQHSLYAAPDLVTLPTRAEVRRGSPTLHGSWLPARGYGCALERRWVPSPFNEEVGTEALVLEALSPKSHLAASGSAPPVNGSGATVELAVERHPASSSVVARKMLRRLRDDVTWLAGQSQRGGEAPPTLQGFAAGDRTPQRAVVERLVAALEERCARDAAAVEAWVGQLLQVAAEGGSAAAETDKRARSLAMHAGFEPLISLELLGELLMSSDGEAELRRINPLLTAEEAYDVLQQAWEPSSGGVWWELHSSVRLGRPCAPWWMWGEL